MRAKAKLMREVYKACLEDTRGSCVRVRFIEARERLFSSVAFSVYRFSLFF